MPWCLPDRGQTLDRESVRVGLPSSLTRRLGDAMRRIANAPAPLFFGGAPKNRRGARTVCHKDRTRTVRQQTRRQRASLRSQFGLRRARLPKPLPKETTKLRVGEIVKPRGNWTFGCPDMKAIMAATLSDVSRHQSGGLRDHWQEAKERNAFDGSQGCVSIPRDVKPGTVVQRSNGRSTWCASASNRTVSVAFGSTVMTLSRSGRKTGTLARLGWIAVRARGRHRPCIRHGPLACPGVLAKPSACPDSERSSMSAAISCQRCASSW